MHAMAADPWPRPDAPRAPASAATFVAVAATADTLQRLRSGGHVLYLRHGTTDNTVADRMPAVDLDDCSTQRPLNGAGKKLMEKVGNNIRKARIPIGEFSVSPLCRARQSAAAAFPELSPEVDANLMYVANLTEEKKAPILRRTRQLLALPVAGGGNRLVLAHAPNLMELMGYFPEEGTLVIFRPQGERQGFEYIASITPAAWAGLLK